MLALHRRSAFEVAHPVLSRPVIIAGQSNGSALVAMISDVMYARTAPTPPNRHGADTTSQAPGAPTFDTSRVVLTRGITRMRRATGYKPNTRLVSAASRARPQFVLRECLTLCHLVQGFDTPAVGFQRRKGKAHVSHDEHCGYASQTDCPRESQSFPLRNVGLSRLLRLRE